MSLWDDLRFLSGDAHPRERDVARRKADQAPVLFDDPSRARTRAAQRDLIDRLETVAPEDLRGALTTWSVDDLTLAGSGLVQFYARLEETKADVLKALAKVVVALRGHFRTPDGDVDWSGRSWEYRQAVSAMYEAAGVPPDSSSNIQASLRYHVGNLLREAVPPRELQAVGLRADSPKERMNLDRQAARAVVQASQPARAGNGDKASRYHASVMEKLRTVNLLVDSLPQPRMIERMTPKERKALAAKLRKVEGALQAFRTLVEALPED